MDSEVAAKMVEASVAASMAARKANEAEQPARELKPIKRGPTWRLADQVNQSWRAFVDESVTLKDIEDERLWTFVAGDLTPFDRVTVISEARLFWADCLVVDAGRGQARVIVLGSIAPIPASLGPHRKQLPEGYDVKRDPVTGRWIAFRVVDGAPMNGAGDLTEEEAFRALLDSNVFRQR